MSLVSATKKRLKDRVATRHRRWNSWERAARSVKALRKQLAAAKAAAKKAARRKPTRMYDAVTIENMPRDAKAVAGYTSGNWPTFPRLAAMFPHARRKSIAVNAAHDADILDVEAGDATPSQAPAWVKRQHARGLKKPGVYCSVSVAQTVVNLLAAAGIKRDQYVLWTAHYTFRAHLCDSRCGFGLRTKADATQFTDKALGRSLDESVTARSFWS